MKTSRRKAAITLAWAFVVGAPQVATAAGTPTAIAAALPPAPVRGPSRAPVLVVAVAEYECPFCKRAETTLNQLRAEYGDQIRVLWRHDPLPFHLRARPAARATLAAERQGKFWAMHDAIFARSDLSDAGLRTAAVVAGLDLARFRIDVTDPALDERLDREAAQAAAVGVAGTPTFFINGKRLVGAQPQPSFRREIDAALAAAEEVRDGAGNLDEARWLQRGGTDGRDLYRWLVAGEPAPLQRAPLPESAQDIWRVPIDARDASVGDVAAAEVTLVAFMDYQCPFCARSAVALRVLQQRFGGTLRIVVKHNPLPFHPLSRPAALAALAAGRQGKFWALHDRMFDHPQELDEGHFFKWAKQLGLDVARFRRDKVDPALARQIDDDMAVAELVEARGTPTFFVNGRKIVGAQPMEVLTAVIEEEAAAARAANRAGPEWYEARIAGGKVFDNLEGLVRNLDVSGLPALGAVTPLVTLVWVTDHQCPFCARLAPTVRRLLEQYPDQLRVVTAPWMAAEHSAFLAAAQAVAAAWLDGGAARFAMLDQDLYVHSHELDPAMVTKLAQQAGLKHHRLQELVANGDVAAILEKAGRVAVVGEAEATPTVFVNGRAVKHVTPGGIERAVASEIARLRAR